MSASMRVTECVIGDILGIPPEDVTRVHILAFGLGYMDDGATCVLPPWRYAAQTPWPPKATASSVPSGPYRTDVPGASSVGPYTIACGAGIALRAAGEPFPDDWRADTDDLITGMGAGEW